MFIFNKSNNFSCTWYGVKRRFLFGYILLFFTILANHNSKAQSLETSDEVLGYWEGEFMPGNSFTLILFFEILAENTFDGRIFLFQGGAQIQNDPLSSINFENNKLSFLIDAKNTPFEGEIKNDGLLLEGNLKFPDGSSQPVLLSKVITPSLTLLDSNQQWEPNFSILSKKYTIEELKFDLIFLTEQLKNIHPQPFKYSSTEEIEKLHVDALDLIKEVMTEDEFFRLIAPVVAGVKCVHTGIRFSNEFTSALQNQKHRLPLDIHFIKNKAYIINNYGSNLFVLPGQEITSINGLPIVEIKQKLLKSIPADGFNNSAKMYEVNNRFSYVFSLYIGNYDQFELELISRNGTKSIEMVKAISDFDYDSAFVSEHPETANIGPIPLQLEMDDNTNTAIISIKAFWSPDWEAYDKFLKTSFNKLNEENIKNLVVDVRGNSGGLPFFSAEFLTYLIKSDIPYFELPIEQGEFAPLYKPIPKKADGFDGNLFILMDGGSLSSTGHFLSLVKYHKLGTLIGEEAGGSYSCNDRSIQLTLPSTHIQFNLPQTTYQTAVEGFETGGSIEPDHIVTENLYDLLNGRDTELEYVLKIVKPL